MTAYSWPAQQAVITALKAASPAVAGGRIYDDPPKPAATTFPFVVLESSQAIPDDVSTATDGVGDAGVSEFFDLHVYDQVASGGRGYARIKPVMDRIHTVLHEKSLTVAGRASALSWVRTTRTFVEGDGVTRRGVVTVEIIHRN